ncbi:MAG: radical SAM protein, partial [Eubacteriales bacterium]|nr:radical SAM protein [Eubacteriales bacterium]
NYGSEFTRLPFEAFLPVLRDDSFQFLSEEALPSGYNIGEIF